MSRHFLSSCCYFSSTVQQVQHLIQEASKVTSERHKLRLNAIFQRDLQQINYFQINYAVYQRQFGRVFHPDMKNVIFLT